MRPRVAIALVSIAALILVSAAAASRLAAQASVLEALSGTASPGPAPVTVVDRSSRQARALAKAAMGQVGTTVSYDPAYVVLDYPGGDVPEKTGVCTDVVVRALRKRGVDLQVEIHEDMSAHFSEYPDRWGLKKPDRNIDHRRVPNVARYFARRGKAVPVTGDGQDYLPGDIVTWKVLDRPHIGIVSTEVAPGGDRWMIAHNMGRGAVIEDVLFEYEITGHYRVYP